MQERRQSDYTRAILVFLVVVLSVGMVFQLRVGIDTHRILTQLEKAGHVDLASRTAGLPNPFEPLDETCTRCHSERRFSGKDLSGTEAKQLLARMSQHPDLNLDAAHWAQLRAALILQRCLPCHDESAVKLFLSMEPYGRHGMVDHMIHSSGSTITRSDTEEIMAAATQLAAQ